MAIRLVESGDVLDADWFSAPIPHKGALSFHVHMSNASGWAAAPTDSPEGVFRLFWAHHDQGYTAGATTGWTEMGATNYPLVKAQLDAVALDGANTVVDEAVIIIEDMPGDVAMLMYDRTGGGGTNSVLDVWAEVKGVFD